ncbi:Csm3p LALA0_S06e03598g [Lachancea lanzarotensis]|uniref:Chromosome segregation in meiosis protein n=1 Tax=Lachancea lanzarotensis TaxID=1245769 RepID=A0A0C7N877_9SACH|nr:uncharacterized protein LALA0_S06e03598g [Lachancea lanzarotensis]CEP62778.1 LALA0S06e03598g1_1 [Lachancea lanzarotensis]
MSQQLLERFSQGPQEDPDSSLPLDPTAINSTGFDDTPLPDPTEVSTRTRRPQVKLTAEKLLSSGGLPKIMKEAPKKTRFSSRKSSYDNLTHFLQFYQLWANDLFPKAKFHDFVTICRTLGKTDKELRNYRIELVRRELGISSVDEPGMESEAQSETLPPNVVENMPPSDPPSPSTRTLPAAGNGREPAVDPTSDEDLIYDRSHTGELRTAEVNEPPQDGQQQQKQSQQKTSFAIAQQDQTESELPQELSDPTVDLSQFSKAATKIREDNEDEDEDELALMREFGM